MLFDWIELRQYYIINVINHIQINPRFKIYTILYLSLIIYLCHVSKLQIFNPLNKPNSKLLEYLSTINTISQIVFDLSVNIFNPRGLGYRSTNEYSRLNRIFRSFVFFILSDITVYEIITLSNNNEIRRPLNLVWQMQKCEWRGLLQVSADFTCKVVSDANNFTRSSTSGICSRMKFIRSPRISVPSCKLIGGKI